MEAFRYLMDPLRTTLLRENQTTLLLCHGVVCGIYLSIWIDSLRYARNYELFINIEEKRRVMRKITYYVRD